MATEEYPFSRHWEEALIAGALVLGATNAFEKEHAAHVARLSVEMFNALAALHGMREHDRVLLEAGALLHDVGRTRGGKEHHKMSRDIIMEDTTLPLAAKERVIIALIARYHRSSLPEASHALFADLRVEEQETVMKLASFVRIADGLDRTHQSVVNTISATIGEKNVTLQVEAAIPSEEDASAGMSKADLFMRVFNCAFNIRWRVREETFPS
jgi:exopolyphosphatase/pppGpp-phosphohydrolase